MALKNDGDISENEMVCRECTCPQKKPSPFSYVHGCPRSTPIRVKGPHVRLMMITAVSVPVVNIICRWH